MPRTREQIQAERRRLKLAYGELYGAVSKLLFRLDPVGISFGSNTDEYEPEVGTILPRLSECRSQADVCRVVHEEFVHWFGDDTSVTRDHYSEIAAEIWRFWLGFKLP